MTIKFSGLAALIAGITCANVDAHAQTKINLLYSPLPTNAAAYVAKDKGLFEKNGLDVDLTFMPNGAAIGPALLSSSAQIGTITPTVLLQGVENGLDIVIIAGGEVFPVTTQSGLVARKDSGIRSIADLAGKKVSVPGLGGSMDLLLRKWLRDSNVRDANIIEIGVAATADAIRSGRVDAGALIDPFYSRLMGMDIDINLGDFYKAPDGTTAFAYAASRSWADKNRDVVKAFRAALAEGAAIVNDNSNEAAVKDLISKYTKLPPQVVATIPRPQLDPTFKPSALDYWIKIMREEGWLKSDIDPTKVVYP